MTDSDWTHSPKIERQHNNAGRCVDLYTSEVSATDNRDTDVIIYSITLFDQPQSSLVDCELVTV